MRKLITLFLICCSIVALAQDDECIPRRLAKKGGWKKNFTTQKASAPDYAIQKQFTDVAHSMMTPYDPVGIRAGYNSFHTARDASRPATFYGYNLRGFPYVCSGDTLFLEPETYNLYSVLVNENFWHMLYDTSTDYTGLGYHDLRPGFPEVIEPGLYKFTEPKASIRKPFDQVRTTWMYTFPGELPFSYVSRKEFLLTRKKNLQRMINEEDRSLQEKLTDLERQKKDLQKILQNDPKQFATWIKNDYDPAPERFRVYHDKTVAAFEKAIARVEELLEAPEDELKQWAIVAVSMQNHLDYNFVDASDPFAKIPVKPNLSYYRKNLNPSVPQLVTVSLNYAPTDTVSVLWDKAIRKLIDLDQFKTWIGKTAVSSKLKL